MDDLLQNFKKYLKDNTLFQQKDTLLIAVSGGVDSVVLCELCFKSGYKFGIAHCNFNLRGAESERDETFVRNLASNYAVELFVKSFDTSTIAANNKMGIEETARNLRYDWFKEILVESKLKQNEPFKYLLTAHHANDNVETVLMNFFRGTGVKGLRGIVAKQENIIRPLLFAKRADIENYATLHNIAYVTDSSNTTSDYTRNYFRNELIPSIQKIFPEVSNNIVRNIERFREIEQVYEESIAATIKKVTEKKGAEIHIPVLKLAKLKPLNSIIYEIIKDYNFSATQVQEVVKLLDSESGKYILSPTHRILHNRKWLIISPLHIKEVVAHFVIEEETTSILFPLGELRLNTIERPISLVSTANIALIDASAIQYPLLLRKWRQGDYFYPLGMQKKKKLSRFFIDQKLSLSQKENVWVLESNKKIIWVVGLRIDDRFKVTSSTLCTVKLNLIPSSQKD